MSAGPRRARSGLEGHHAASAVLALVTVAATASCETESPAEAPLRQTLPNGAVLVRYPSLPSLDHVGTEVSEAHVDLRIGTVDGDDPNYIFGDIRGVQSASDGTIYVLDYQAVEIRVYSSSGEYLQTIVRHGEGPGEIMEANGILLSGDTLLWIHDHSQYAIIGVDPTGEELRRFDKPIRDYGYIWDGAFDRQGRYWRGITHSDEDEEYRRRDPEPGLLTGSGRRYFKSYDLFAEVLDSVYVGDRLYRAYSVATSDGGRWGTPIPFEATNTTVVNPSGGFWHVNTAAYQLTRTTEEGDTLVVIEAVVPVVEVGAADRSAYIQRVVDDWGADLRRGAEAVAALMPDVKPILAGLYVDGDGRLWVERATPNDVPPFYDRFAQNGDYLGSVRLAFEPRPYSKLSVQHGSIYTWVVDELDTPFVVRAPVS